jgi:glycosyltransferase involved in cell wall biosynthesis
MKIVHYIPTSFPVKGYGGTERIAFWLGKAQAEMGHQVTFLCQKDGELPFAETIDVPSQIDDLTPFIPSGTDIVQLYNVFPNSLEVADRLGIAMEQIHTPQFKLDCPFLVGIHGNGKSREAFHPNSTFVSCNHAQRHGWTEYVHNGVDLSEYNWNAKKDNYFLFLAKASWTVKNLAGAIRIANRAKVTLQVGGGKAPFWSQGVISHGTVDGSKKLELLMQAQALLFPIIWNDPCPVAVLESLACGTPVIATRRGSLEELVGPCGVLANSMDEFLDAVNTVKTIDPESCRSRAEEKFTHIRMADKYLSYYELILKNGFIRDGFPVTPEKTKKTLYYSQSPIAQANDYLTSIYLHYFA